VAAFVAVGKGRTALEVSAGQIVEEHVEGGTEEIFPAGLQESEQVGLVGEQAVQAAIGIVLGDEGKIFAEQIAQRGAQKPFAMQAPFAARIDEPISGEDLEEVIPGSAFAAGRQAAAPEVAEVKEIPKLERQPAGAPLARTAKGELTQAQWHAVVGDGGGHGPIVGKEGEGLGLLRDRIEGGEGAGPGGVLGIVDLAQVEEWAVEDAPVGDAAFFHERPVTVFFAVFAARVAFEIHAGPSVAAARGGWEWGRSAPRRFGGGKVRKMGRFQAICPRK
jgi:hypothetical protein